MLLTERLTIKSQEKNKKFSKNVLIFYEDMGITKKTSRDAGIIR